MTDANTLKRNTAWLSIMSNTLLVILKLAVGLYVGAVSLVSEALHSGVDLIAAFIAIIIGCLVFIPAILEKINQFV